MIIEINYTALQWDNHQGGSGKPITGRLLRDLDSEFEIGSLRKYAEKELEYKKHETKTLIGDYRLVNIIIDT